MWRCKRSADPKIDPIRARSWYYYSSRLLINRKHGFEQCSGGHSSSTSGRHGWTTVFASNRPECVDGCRRGSRQDRSTTVVSEFESIPIACSFGFDHKYSQWPRKQWRSSPNSLDILVGQVSHFLTNFRVIAKKISSFLGMATIENGKHDWNSFRDVTLDLLLSYDQMTI